MFMSDLHLSAQCMQHWCEVMQCLHTKLLKRLLKKTNNNNKTYIHTYIHNGNVPPPYYHYQTWTVQLWPKCLSQLLGSILGLWIFNKMIDSFLWFKKKTNKKDIKLFLYSYCMTKLCKKICIQIKLVLIQWSF